MGVKVNTGTGPATGSLKVAHESLWSTDPRVDLIADDPADQTTKMNAFLSLVCGGTTGKDRVAYLLPGTYKVSDELVCPNVTASKSVKFIGGGGLQHAGAPTVIDHTVDAGAGKWALNVTSAAAPIWLEGISFVGNSSAPATKGTDVWLMRGVRIPGKMIMKDMTVLWYGCGVGISGDHISIEDCILQGNTYGVEFPPGNPTQGDIKLRNCQMGTSSKAAVGIAKSSSMGGTFFEHCEMSDGPYVFLRYDDGGAPTVGNWITGMKVVNVATEYVGNGIVYDEVQDGAGITEVEFDHGIINWGLYSDHIWTGRTPVAAWFNGGPISNTRFVNSMPTSTQVLGAGPYLPALKATSLVNVRYDGQVGAYATYLPTTGQRIFEATSSLVKCYVGGRNGVGALLIQPYFLSGSVARGELLTNNNETGAIKFSGLVSGRIPRVIGVAAHAATTGQVIHAIKAGQETDTQVLNTSGATIAGGELLIPHASGGVAGAGSTYGGQVIGRMLYSTATATLGTAELFID